MSLVIPMLSVLEPLLGQVDCWAVLDHPWCSHGVCLTHQAGATAIDWSVNKHERIVLFLESLYLFVGPDHLSTRQQVPNQYTPPAACSRACVCVCRRETLQLSILEFWCLYHLFSPCICPLLQAQLRAFIPEMLKYSTGRGKPGWGKESCKPVWWPEDIPWANVRSDVRTEEQKQRVRKNKCNDVLLCWSLWGNAVLPLPASSLYYISVISCIQWLSIFRHPGSWPWVTCGTVVLKLICSITHINSHFSLPRCLGRRRCGPLWRTATSSMAERICCMLLKTSR